MRKIFICILLYGFHYSFAQENPLEIEGSLILNTNGIDPVPAFSLEKPALMSTFMLTKGKFSWVSIFNFSVTDFKPWSQTNYLYFKLPVSEKGAIRLGPGISFFHKRAFLNLPSNSGAESQVLNQYLVFEASYWHNLSERVGFSLLNWAVKGIENDAVQWGNFTSLVIDISKIPIGKNLEFGISPNLFFLVNELPFKGLFISEISTLFIRDWRFSLYNQVVLPVWTDPETSLSWSIGMMFKF